MRAKLEDLGKQRPQQIEENALDHVVASPLAFKVDITETIHAIRIVQSSNLMISKLMALDELDATSVINLYDQVSVIQSVL